MDEVTFSFLGWSRTPEPELSHAIVEAAVEATLRDGAAESYAGQRFWWMDRDRLILERAHGALRAGEPVAIDDYGERDVRPAWFATAEG